MIQSLIMEMSELQTLFIGTGKETKPKPQLILPGFDLVTSENVVQWSNLSNQDIVRLDTEKNF